MILWSKDVTIEDIEIPAPAKPPSARWTAYGTLGYGPDGQSITFGLQRKLFGPVVAGGNIVSYTGNTTANAYVGFVKTW